VLLFKNIRFFLKNSCQIGKVDLNKNQGDKNEEEIKTKIE
jgi:hypothetical protein